MLPSDQELVRGIEPERLAVEVGGGVGLPQVLGADRHPEAEPGALPVREDAAARRGLSRERPRGRARPAPGVETHLRPESP